MRVYTLLLILSANVFANFSTFNGSVYSEVAIQDCHTDFTMISDKLNSLAGFQVVDGGCLDYGLNRVKLKFNYHHPMTRNIEEFTTNFKSNENCEFYRSEIKNVVEESGNKFLFSRCADKKMIVSHVDYNYSMVRTIRDLGVYKDAIKCNEFVSEFKKNAKINNIHTYVGVCEEQNYGFSGESFYKPLISVSANFSIKVNVLKGRGVLSQNECANERINTERNFSNSGIKVIYSYCTQSKMDDSLLNEYILYIEPKAPRYITQYRSLNTTTEVACVEQSEKIGSTLESLGHSILYSYCKKINDKLYSPEVTYLK